MLSAAQSAYDAGEVTRQEVEALAGYVSLRSREVPQDDEDRLSDLLARQPVVRVRSRLLGEVLVWLSDEAETPPGTAEVVYRESELRRLAGRSPAEVSAVHEAKRALDGELVG